MDGYFTRNKFPKIKLDYISTDKLNQIRIYLSSGEFRNDFRECYWKGDISSSDIISLNHQGLENGRVKDFEISIRDDEDLVKESIDKHKLSKHYKKLIDMLLDN